MEETINEIRAQLGQGHDFGPEFEAWIRGHEFTRRYTAVLLKDYKNGELLDFRTHYEKWLYYTLRYDDSVTAIYTKVPLCNADTQAIAKELGIKHPYNAEHVVTSDFVALSGDKITVYFVMGERFNYHMKGIAERVKLQEAYWTRKGAEVKKLTAVKDLDPVYANNIQSFSSYWKIENVHDKTDFVKYLIMHHNIEVDLHSNNIFMPAVMDKFNSYIEDEWNRYQIRMQKQNG